MSKEFGTQIIKRPNGTLEFRCWDYSDEPDPEPEYYCDPENFLNSLPDDPLFEVPFNVRGVRIPDDVGVILSPVAIPKINAEKIKLKLIPAELTDKLRPLRLSGDLLYDELMYDFSKLEKEYLEELKTILSKLNYNYIAKRLLEELDPPRFYCEGETYNNINDIRWNKKIEIYYKKLQNMQFSNGEHLNLKDIVYYAKLLYAFQCHLDNLKDSYINCKGWNSVTNERAELKLEIQYRNSDKYKRRSIARCYALMDVLPKDQKVTMITFTTGQRDSEGRALDYRKQVSKLQENIAKLHDLIRKDYPGVPYMHVTESHQTGYLHVHRIYGCDIPKEFQEKYKRLWESYGAGSYEHGLNFKYSSYDEYEIEHGKTEKSKEYTSCQSAFLYAIKYISKSISEKGTAPFHEFVTDAVIWYMSKRKVRNYKGVRSFYISPKWNALIREKFDKKGSIMVWELITLHYKDIEIVIYDSNSIPPLESFMKPSQDFSPPTCTA